MHTPLQLMRPAWQESEHEPPLQTWPFVQLAPALPPPFPHWPFAPQ
jgi:hypothetical protein